MTDYPYRDDRGVACWIPVEGANTPYETVNGYNVPVTVFTCEYCGQVFSCTPAIKPDNYPSWRGCLGDTCTSYDPRRDAGIYFDLGMVDKADPPTPEAGDDRPLSSPEPGHIDPPASGLNGDDERGGSDDH